MFVFSSLAGSSEANANLRLEITKCLGREKDLEGINQMLKDEHQALQLAFASLEEKLRKSQVYYIKFLVFMFFFLLKIYIYIFFCCILLKEIV